jgi:hypothetical protein
MKKTTLKSILAQCKKTINTIFDDAEEARLTKQQMDEVLDFIAKQTSDQDLVDTESIKPTEPKSSIFRTGSAAEERGAYVHTKSASEKFDSMNGR